MADKHKQSAVEKAAAAAAKAARNRKSRPIDNTPRPAAASTPPAVGPAADDAERAGSSKAPASGSTATENAAGGDSSVASDASVLRCSGVWQRYPSPKGGHQVVLNNIDLHIPEPQFISVVGPSGCGKSTLLRVILGSEPPWRGSVEAGGQHEVHPDRHRGIVFQRYSLFPHITV